jgi:hypothetical protein
MPTLELKGILQRHPYEKEVYRKTKKGGHLFQRNCPRWVVELITSINPKRIDQLPKQLKDMKELHGWAFGI